MVTGKDKYILNFMEVSNRLHQKISSHFYYEPENELEVNHLWTAPVV